MAEKEYIRPTDIPEEQANRVLGFLNYARSAEEIAAAIEFPGERDVGMRIARNILARREELGVFKDLGQVDAIRQIGPERFTEIVRALRVREEKIMKREELVEYSIKGRIDEKDLKKVPEEVRLKAYAVRDRRVLGSARVNEDGTFEITYEFAEFGKDKEAYGVDLIIGPELPAEEILKTKLDRWFLHSGGFKRASPKYEYMIEKPLILSDKYMVAISEVVLGFKHTFIYTGFVYTCSPLSIPPGGWAGCSSPEALSDAEAFVRLSKGSKIIAEDIELKITGEFEFTETWYSSFWITIFHGYGVNVEVYQKIGNLEYTLYQDVHDFTHNVAELIFIDREQVQIIPSPPDPTPGVGNTFSFERIGNIPIECIFKAGDPDLPGTDFIGYVDSSGDRPGIVLGDADTKVKDYAFCGELHLYANLGEGFGTPYSGGVDMSDVSVKYFRIKRSYTDPLSATAIETWMDIPFHNTRKLAAGGTASDFMGPFTIHPVTSAVVDPFYIYPNPYDTDPDKNWKYRGLVLVLNTYTLPLKYGLFTFTIEPLDNNLNPLTVSNPQECVLKILIDNDIGPALTGEIEDIMGVLACEILNLGPGSQNITVPFNLNDAHGNLLKFTLVAYWGDNKNLTLVPSSDFVPAHQYSRGATPYWNGGSYSVTKNHDWQQCAYQFRLVVYRRVTNGYHKESIWKEFNKHITIMHPGTPYTP